MNDFDLLVQQLITGLSNGTIIALIALGYTMVYGIVELINFAHGDLFMLGGFLALTLVGLLGVSPDASWPHLVASLSILFVAVPAFCAGLNWAVDRICYSKLRNAPRLAPLVSAIGVSFVFLNIGLLWGALPMGVFEGGNAAAAPKDFPALVSGSTNLLGESASLVLTPRDIMVFAVTVPLLISLSLLVKYTTLGKAMRAVAQNPSAARLMGIDVERVIGITFLLGGALAGVASVVFALYINTVHFQMGFRGGMDAFAAAVLGGIGNLPGAFLGGIVIGVVRALSDTYIGSSWTNVVVFSILIGVLVFRPSGLLGAPHRDKV